MIQFGAGAKVKVILHCCKPFNELLILFNGHNIPYYVIYMMEDCLSYDLTCFSALTFLRHSSISQKMLQMVMDVKNCDGF